MRLALLVMLIGACGGGPSIPPGGDDDNPPPPPSDAGGGSGGGGSGRLSFSWELQFQAGGVVDCLEVSANVLQITSSNFTTGDVMSKRFSCMSGVGAIDLEAGEHQIGFSLLDKFDSTVSVIPAEDHTINSGDDLDIGQRIFVF